MKVGDKVKPKQTIMDINKTYTLAENNIFPVRSFINDTHITIDFRSLNLFYNKNFDNIVWRICDFEVVESINKTNALLENIMKHFN
jgi:hypothetical protein